MLELLDGANVHPLMGSTNLCMPALSAIIEGKLCSHLKVFLGSYLRQKGHDLALNLLTALRQSLQQPLRQLEGVNHVIQPAR